MTRCLLVHPKFSGLSFWDYRETCALMRAKYPAAPLGIITVAALLPKTWEVKFIDCNVERFDDSAFDRADLVLMGGMLPQQRDALRVISAAHARGKPVVMGGPDCTSNPEIYRDADFRVLGEAEVTLPEFLRDWERGRARALYRSSDRADMTRSPLPRFDLLKLDRYLHVGIQWGRGCPFSCEFCDIIELFGRAPRAKTNAQVIAELQYLYDLGYRGHIDIVDDNFIGYKKLAKQFLPELRRWLEENDWPFEFSAEASINLAYDDELLTLMRDCNFWSVFVGIETPDEETLRRIGKRQNVAKSMAASIRKINAYGMSVNAGFILGFDTDRDGVAGRLIRCVEETSVPASMVGLLFALPGTQLARRLKAEGRLPENFAQASDSMGDQCSGGLNFETRRPREAILRDYLRVVETIYNPSRYFGRVGRVGLRLNASGKRLHIPLRKRLSELAGFSRLIRRMGFRARTRRQFWKTFLHVLIRNPKAVRYTVALMALYLHFDTFSRHLSGRLRCEIDTAGRNGHNCIT